MICRSFLFIFGKTIICYGEEKTPQMLRNVVDEFILCKTPIKKEKTSTLYCKPEPIKIQSIKKDHLLEPKKIQKINLLIKEIEEMNDYDLLFFNLFKLLFFLNLNARL
jgi:hypothetical protein